jgi:predicted small lipoprotein YifL
MKKIRILAAVLAVLMLPLATLFACGKTEPVEPPKQDTSTLIIDPNNPPPEKVVEVDNDGSKDGYLLFYNFNEHKAGNLKEAEPYSDFITGVAKDGCAYVVLSKKGAENDNALLIQRPAGNTQDPYLSIALKTKTTEE